jgi:nuclear pore complex protein Nup98-Nup96
MSDSILDNTIKELVTIPEKQKEVQSPQQKSVKETLTVSPSSSSTVNESVLSDKSYLNESVNPNASILDDNEPCVPHSTGIVLRRPGYYTIPSLDEIAAAVNEEGRYVLADFTIARKGYGNVYFAGPIDVTDLNLDEIVHFR